MHTTDPAAIAEFVLAEFAAIVELDAAWLKAADPRLSDIMSASDSLTNSVDLMEAFARVGANLRRRHGVRVRLPALPMDTPFSAVVAALVQELAAAVEEA